MTTFLVALGTFTLGWLAKDFKDFWDEYQETLKYVHWDGTKASVRLKGYEQDKVDELMARLGYRPADEVVEIPEEEVS